MESRQTEVKCDSVAGWLEAIAAKRREGRVLAPADDPYRRCIGFEIVGTGEWYYLTLTQLKDVQTGSDRKEAALKSLGLTDTEFRTALLSSAGRESILRRPLGF